MVACMKCEEQMVPKKTGATMLELTKAGEAYNQWHADVFECRSCGAIVAADFGRCPTKHYIDRDAPDEVKHDFKFAHR